MSFISTRRKSFNPKRFPSENKQNTENTRDGMDFPIVLSEKFSTVNDDNVYTVPIMADKDILGFLQSSKNINDADSDDENGINKATPFPTSSEMRNVMKSRRHYLDTHSNGEINNKMVDIEQRFVDNLILKKQCKGKYQFFFQKNQ
ncbi:hypothetical protein TNCV_3774131 [Trichonephila clavipes]|nr:hypothetical protein TNCV_3774131 [Trichonephila clavipes]